MISLLLYFLLHLFHLQFNTFVEIMASSVRLLVVLLILILGVLLLLVLVDRFILFGLPLFSLGSVGCGNRLVAASTPTLTFS